MDGRIVFLGDSITDGHTYLLLIQQSLAGCTSARFSLFNAGVGGDTARDMLARFDRDVAPHRPTMVGISAGVNDRVGPEQFESDLLAILESIAQISSEPILMTTSIASARDLEHAHRLESYNQRIRAVARGQGIRLAEVHARMREASAAGIEQLTDDGVHPGFEGHRSIARAVLDALGLQKLPVPTCLTLAPLPGIVPYWRLKKVASDALALDRESALALGAADCPCELRLPLSTAGDTSVWQEQERQRGFAIGLGRLFGPPSRFVGVASIESDREQTCTLCTGAGLLRVFLNGNLVYARSAWSGWHAGKERFACWLRAGSNSLVIECGDDFLLTLTT